MAVVSPPRRTATPARRPSRRRGFLRHQPSRLTYLSLLALVFFSAFPFYYSIVVASHDNSVVAQMPPPLFPGGNLFDNIERAFGTGLMTRALVNSFLVSGTITISVVFFSTLAGFAFAKLRFRGRNVLLLIIIGTMMVPTQIAIIPLYLLMAKFQLVGTLPAVIVPSMVSGFGVFFMTQYLRTAVPTTLIEAARADGCTTAGVLWYVVRPAARPAAAVLATLTFMNSWNDFFWPLVALNPDDPTVQVALSSLSSGYAGDFSLAFAGAFIATIPLLLVFFFLGRRIITGIMQGTPNR
ncbi:carbohydrate ABC transporter permease [Jidongwangia harbinensis]|uniref:carbohydrate ABC transporter permease n=1 Tax=Jidongwangia harbinensis TaxID=2878561 RepID=UPI001CDA5312|nr:carbohydrate ABC transporter permease [Jidongwangia harbinensis]MCA2216623.1 carbohydrate ABC transporter permease [Jidongwangia harbinensis]